MNKNLRWIGLAAFSPLLCAIIIIILLLFFGGTHACDLAQAIEPGRTNYGNWCLEFWLFRYQGLLGALATIGAGSFAYSAIQKQIAAGMIDGKRRELMHINAMLANMRWVNDLTDLFDSKNALSVRNIWNKDDVPIRASVKANKDAFVAGQQQLIVGMDLFMAMSDLNIEAIMADSALTTLQIPITHARITSNGVMDAGAEALLKTSMQQEVGHITKLNSASDKVRELLRARASKIEAAINKFDPI